MEEDLGKLCLECRKRIQFGVWCICNLNVEYVFCNDNCKANFLTRLPDLFEENTTRGLGSSVRLINEGYFMR